MAPGFGTGTLAFGEQKTPQRRVKAWQLQTIAESASAKGVKRGWIVMENQQRQAVAS